MTAHRAGYWRRIGRRFWGQRLNRVAGWSLALLVVVAAAADLLASDRPLLARFDGDLYVLASLYDPAALRPYDKDRLAKGRRPGDFAIFPPVPWGVNTHDLEAVLSPPSRRHLLGTDASGRDVLARIVHGARVSLVVGAVAVLVLLGVGMLLGGLAGYYGGWLDGLIMRTVEVFLSIPTFLLVITVLAVLSPSGWGAVVAMMVVIGLTRWPDVARLVRGEILRVKTLDYVLAARALGGSDVHVVVRHLLPNTLGPVLVAATFAMAGAILVEGALSFLGFGVPGDMASWGGLLTEARHNALAWWLAVFPGAAIFLTVTAWNLLGEGVRDAIDPRLEV